MRFSESSVLLVAVFAMLLGISYAQGQLWQLHGLVEIRNAAMPVYLEPGRPIAILRASRIFSDYQRRGFFRIGALPMVAVQDLAVEVREPAELAEVLKKLELQFGSGTKEKNAVEIRSFSLSFSGEDAPRLTAIIVRPQSPDLWRLQEGVFLGESGKPMRFRHALLSLTGPLAGQIRSRNGDGNASSISLLNPRDKTPVEMN